MQILAGWDLTRYCRCVCLEISKSLNIQVFRIVPKLAVSVSAGAAVPSPPPTDPAHHDAADVATTSTANGSRNGRQKQRQ